MNNYHTQQKNESGGDRKFLYPSIVRTLELGEMLGEMFHSVVSQALRFWYVWPINVCTRRKEGEGWGKGERNRKEGEGKGTELTDLYCFKPRQC